MNNQLLHTPEGVRDIYNQECDKKLELQNKLHAILKSYGYQDIQTPTFEFFDIFKKERGSVVSKEMYKFFDREGNTLVLRPDITPSIARAAAKYFMEEDMPLRFCYTGNTFINNHSYQGRLKESTQLGCELIGDDTVDADAELIAMIIRCMLAAGLTEFQVEIGQVDFFKGLVLEAGIDEDTETSLRELISNKNYFGAEELLKESGVHPEIRDTFLKLPALFGTVEKLKEAKTLTDNRVSLKAIERLEEIYHILEIYRLENYVSFELGMLGRYKYYTGVIFQAYTYGTGEMIVTGGRYNSLLRQFGKDAAAIGFGLNVDQLLFALSRQKITIPIPDPDAFLVYESCQQERAITFAEELRGQGSQVTLIRKRPAKQLKEYQEYADQNHVCTFYYINEAGNIQTGEKKQRMEE